MAPKGNPQGEPEIVEMPPQRMAVIYARGKPDQVFPQVLPLLYSSVFALKFGFKKSGQPTFSVSGLRARYPDAHLVPVEEWTNVIGLPVPVDTASLPQKIGGAEVRLEEWEYGTVAQILHVGPYGDEPASVERLLRFVSTNGYDIIGVHEEEYLTRPEAAAQKTIIRYRVMKR